MHVLGMVERVVNGALEPLGVKLTRRAGPRTIGGRRMTDDDVIALARRRGTSHGALLEEMFGREGRADEIIRRMRESGALSDATRTVCEIGPGSGLYIGPVLRHAPVTRYEIYEIEPRRADYLASEFTVVKQPTDGERLAATADRSIDLVHSHGVFVTLDFLTSCSYFREITRVIAPGGHVVLDAMTEDCLDDLAIESWLASGLRYPSLLARAYVLDFFTTRGFTLVDEFHMPLLVHGTSRYLILRWPGGTD
jgi:SAM-dependent methyltransferase